MDNVRRLAVVLVLTSILLAAACHKADPLAGDPDPAVCTTLKLKYEAIDRALYRRDYRSLEEMMTADFTSRTADGTVMSRQEVIRSLAAMDKFAVDLISMSHIARCAVNGPQAELLVESDQKARWTDNRRQEHVKITHYQTRDSWRLLAGEWKRESVVEISHTSTLDGVAEH